MSRKTLNKSVTSDFVMSDLDAILIACPGMHPDEARSMPVVRASVVSATRSPVKITGDVIRPQDSLGLSFAKPAKRVTRANAEHTLRLSSSANDSDAMKAFLANGGDITVLPTRTAKGFKRSKVRVGSAGTNTAERSRKAHNKVARDSRSFR